MEECLQPTLPTRTTLVGIRKLARELKYSHSHISYVLKGKRMPSKKLANALKRRGYEVVTMEDK